VFAPIIIEVIIWIIIFLIIGSSKKEW
jgi:hypothetical protein